MRNVCLKIAPKGRQLEKRSHRSNSAARGQTAFKFHKIGLHGSRKARNCENPLKDKTKMANDAQFFKYTDPYIFGTAKAINFKFGVCINYEK